MPMAYDRLSNRDMHPRTLMGPVKTAGCLYGVVSSSSNLIAYLQESEIHLCLGSMSMPVF